MVWEAEFPCRWPSFAAHRKPAIAARWSRKRRSPGAGFGGANRNALYRFAFTRPLWLDSTVEGEPPHAANSTVEIADVDAVLGNIGFLNHDFCGGDDHCGMLHIRTLETGHRNFIARSSLVCDQVDVIPVDVKIHHAGIDVEELSST